MIIFFAFFFNILRRNRFDKVSIVSPDFEMTMNSVLLVLDFLDLPFFFHLNYQKNKFFFIFSSKKLKIASEPRTDPPIPIKTIFLNFLNFFKS